MSISIELLKILSELTCLPQSRNLVNSRKYLVRWLLAQILPMPLLMPTQYMTVGSLQVGCHILFLNVHII